MKLYLAAPFAAWLGTDGVVIPQAQQLMIHIKTTLQRCGHELLMPHEREDWGRKIDPPIKCTHLDSVAVQQADGVIAIPQTSGGVHIELGWASALLKPILIFVDGPATALVAGLPAITDVSLCNVDLTFIDVVSDLCTAWAATTEAKLHAKKAAQTSRPAQAGT